MFDDRILQLFTQAVNQTPAAPHLTASAKTDLVHTLYRQYEQQLSYTILDLLTDDATITYLTMLEETVPQQTMTTFLEEHIPDIATVIEHFTQQFLDNYLQAAQATV